MIKGFLYILLSLDKFKANHYQIFFLLLLIFQRYAAVILSGTITWRIQGKINVNGVLVPVVQRGVHPQNVAKKKTSF